MRNASRYRSLLEGSLPDIFESLQARPLSVSPQALACIALCGGHITLSRCCLPEQGCVFLLSTSACLPSGKYGVMCGAVSVKLRLEHQHTARRERPCLQETYRLVDGRMAQEALRRHVLRLLRVWRSWFIFSDDFLNGLQARLLPSPVAPALCFGAWHCGDATPLQAHCLCLSPFCSLSVVCRAVPCFGWADIISRPTSLEVSGLHIGLPCHCT